MIAYAAAVLIVGVLYWFPIRRLFREWGATDRELTRHMVGDNLIPDADYQATLAITIDALPRDIWPWLLQMGYQRGGLYSYDWLDRMFGYLDRPSTNRILRRFQHLKEGDVIPLGRGHHLDVRVLEPYEAMLLVSQGGTWTWSFGLFSVDDRRTRLVSRSRGLVPSTMGWRLFVLVLEVAAFLMTRKMLLGIKRRAEALKTGAASSRRRAA